MLPVGITVAVQVAGVVEQAMPLTDQLPVASLVLVSVSLRAPERPTVAFSLHVTVPVTVACPLTLSALPVAAGVTVTASGAGAGPFSMSTSPVACEVVLPSHCCTKVASKLWIQPFGPKTALLTVKEPVTVLQPRPSPYSDKPGWVEAWKG